jgi:integrase
VEPKRYPNLHRVGWTKNWVFRKYSAQKRKEFVRSTGLEATEKNVARAHRRGMEIYAEWLGAFVPTGQQLLIKDLARVILAGTDRRRPNTYRAKKHQMENHVIPAFGHLKPEQVTAIRWRIYDQEERRKGKRGKLYNTRKALLECLHRAKGEGLIRDVPKLPNLDAPAAPPRYISFQDFRKIRQAMPKKMRLLVYIMYYQGARPSEVLQYRWDMIRWGEGEHGMLEIPGSITKTKRNRKIPLNSRVARVLGRVAATAIPPVIFPSREDPERPIANYNAVWDRAMVKSELDFTIYNLRDSFITNALKRGLSSVFIGKYCDTSAGMVDRKYSVPIAEAMRQVAG